MANTLLHSWAGLVAAIVAIAIYRNTYAFITKGVEMRHVVERAFAGAVSTIPAALVLFAAFVLGARL